VCFPQGFAQADEWLEAMGCNITVKWAWHIHPGAARFEAIMTTSSATPPSTLFSRYRAWRASYGKDMVLDHGWEVPVPCSVCGRNEVPVYEGWTPSQVIHFGKKPTIYAKLQCGRCGKDLKQEAGEELVRLFADQPVDPRSRRILTFMVVGICLWLALGFGLNFVLPQPWFSFVVVGPIALLTPLLMLVNSKINAIRRVCPCGSPAYKFMGLLGRTYCHRCSTCGRLLRLQD
jgi:hypothetical protein